MEESLSLTKSSYEDDCRQIHRQWGRLNRLGQILAGRSLHERLRIRETYLAKYGEDLTEGLHQAVVANQENELCNVLWLWMNKENERDAIIARNAIENINAEYMALIEIYTCRKPSQLFSVKQEYRERFNRSLHQNIITDLSNPCQKILMALATTQNSHQTEISQHIANCDAKRLYETVKGALGGGIDDVVILEILSKRSIPQNRLTLSSYKHIYGHNYTKSMKEKSSNEYEESLRAVIKCIYNPSKYYAKLLYVSMRGMTRDKTALGRVMVTRAEVDMPEIKKEFQNRFMINLHDAITENVQNIEFRDFLIALECHHFYHPKAHKF